jgi:FAD/FMN-containing dehydrogenase
MFATLSLPAGQDLPAPHRATAVRVRSASELQGALRHARQNALTLDGSGLDRVLRIDAARGLLEVQAATSWRELTRYLAMQKITLEGFSDRAGLPATVAEAIAHAAAGPDGLPVTAHVTAVTLVTPEGELRRADRGGNRQLLRLVLGGQGVIGVLYSVTLSIDSLRRSAANALAPVELGIDVPAHETAAASSIECLLPPEQLDGFLKDLRACVDERSLTLLGITVRRHLPDDSCQLSWSTREWAGVEIRFGRKTTLGASVAAAEVRRALLAFALARGGSFALRHAPDATRQQLEVCYPALKGFLAEKRRGDAAERLQNDWYRCVAGKLRGEACESRWGKN